MYDFVSCCGSTAFVAVVGSLVVLFCWRKTSGNDEVKEKTRDIPFGEGQRLGMTTLQRLARGEWLAYDPKTKELGFSKYILGDNPSSKEDYEWRFLRAPNGTFRIESIAAMRIGGKSTMLALAGENRAWVTEPTWDQDQWWGMKSSHAIPKCQLIFARAGDGNYAPNTYKDNHYAYIASAESFQDKTLQNRTGNWWMDRLHATEVNLPWEDPRYNWFVAPLPTSA